MMKAARLKGDLLARKGTAAPVPGVGPRYRKPAARPHLAAVDPGSAKQKLKRTAEGRRGERHREIKRDKFGCVWVSLRLDPHRHMRLKLLSAHSRMSLQETLIAALDAYYGDEAPSVNNGNCDCLQKTAQQPQDDEQPQAAEFKDAE